MRRTHRIYLDTWLINSAIVGFYSILKNANKDHLIDFNASKNYIDVDESFLDGFEDDYFNYFIDTHIENLVYTKMTEKIKKILSADDETINLNIDEFNEDITYIQSKLNLKSVCTAFDLAEVSERVVKVKKIKITKKSNNIDDAKEALITIDELLSDEKVARFIKVENALHSVLNNFHANVGILHKNASKLNKFNVYNQYFIEPTEDYLSLSYKPKEDSFVCSTCENTINKKKESFNLAWIKGIGVDINRKTNYYHNFVNTTFICPVCNLILSCAPAGFHFDLISRKGIFINDNRSIQTLIAANKSTSSKTTMSEFENECYQNLIDSASINNASELEKFNFNIQTVKFDADSRTIYSFHLINNELVRTIYINRNRLAALVNKKAKLENEYIDLYQASINSLLRHGNTFELFNTLLRGKYHNGVILSIILNLSVKGDDMKKENALARKFQGHGAKLAIRLKNTDENKLNKLRFNIAKAIKYNDAFSFIENISFYTSQCNIEMFKEIVEITQNIDSFKLFGSALLAGLHLEKNTESTDKKE